MTAPLLAPDEARAFHVANQNGQGPGVIVCDHASARIPRALAATFGVSPENMQRHVALDIGAAALSVGLAAALDMPAVIAAYSRLVIDLNRAPDHPELIPPSSDGVRVPGNMNLTPAARAARMDALFHPFQDAVATETARARMRTHRPCMLAIHSFTPALQDGVLRPWHAAVLWNKEEALAHAFADGILKARPETVLGMNTPYTLKDARFKGSTVSRHAEEAGLPYLFLEVRQDLLQADHAIAEWVDVIARAARPLLGSST